MVYPPVQHYMKRREEKRREEKRREEKRREEKRRKEKKKRKLILNSLEDSRGKIPSWMS